MKNQRSGQLFVTHLGIGVANYFIRDEGRFQVRYKTEVMDFDTLLKAFLFYESLGYEASIWDMTHEPILVESKILVTVN